MKTKKLIVTSLAILLAAAALFSVPRALETSAAGAEINVAARAAMLLDCDSGSVVYAQNETLRTPIASMVKIMTLDIAFDELEAGRLDCSEMISVSENASGMGGSQAFLRAYGKYDAGELLRSIVVASANDSCVAIAERIAGTVDAFVARMNDKAKALGMSDTAFVNCTGLPAEGQYSCAKDVAVMSRELFSHRKFFEYAGTWMYDFRHPDGATTLLTNTNKLIKSYTGCDGGKTGFTGEAMSCLSATAKRGNTRLISIVLGAADGPLSASIGAASILAKVTRDRYMLELDRRYPQYRLAQHKGYGTKLHYELLEKYGVAPFYRRSFLKNRLFPDAAPAPQTPAKEKTPDV